MSETSSCLPLYCLPESHWIHALCIILVHYSLKANSDLCQHIKSSQCEFATFSQDPDSYFIKHKSRGSWSAHFEEPHISAIVQLRENMKHFDLGLKWIIFGYGGTHIYQFETGFMLYAQGRHEDPEHPLCKVSPSFLLSYFQKKSMSSLQALKKFDDDTEHTWTVDKGSSLCLYDDRYYILRVKESDSSTSELVYNLPPAMDEKLKELIELARTPEEQQGM